MRFTPITPASAEILFDPDPCGHIVYPYTDESHFADALGLFVYAGLMKGDAVILVMTAPHAERIRRWLKDQEFDVAALESTGQLVCLNAHKLLSTFMFDGKIDEDLFKTNFGRLIQNAKTGSGNFRPVRVFGEMVDVLWKDYPQATERLEELGNDLIAEHEVAVFCAYSLVGSATTTLPESLLTLHSHTVV